MGVPIASSSTLPHAHRAVLRVLGGSAIRSLCACPLDARLSCIVHASGPFASTNFRAAQHAEGHLQVVGVGDRKPTSTPPSWPRLGLQGSRARVVCLLHSLLLARHKFMGMVNEEIRCGENHQTLCWHRTIRESKLLAASCAGTEGRLEVPSPHHHVRGLEDLLGASLGRVGALFSLGLSQPEESTHAPHLPQEGPIVGDLPFLVGDDFVAGLSGLPYLLLQGAHGFLGLPYLLLQGTHGLLGLLPKLLLPVFDEPYLRAQPNLLLAGGRVDLGELDVGGVEGLAHDEDRALAGEGRRQVGDHPGEALDGQTPWGLMPFFGRRPPPTGPPPPSPDLLARVVGPRVVVFVRVPPEEAVRAHICLPPSCSSSMNCNYFNSLIRALSTFSGVLGAVGMVTWKVTVVGGDKGIEEVLQLPDAR